MKIVNIKYVDKNKFSALVNGVYCEISVNANFIEDIKSGWFDQGGPCTEEDATRIISIKMIEYYNSHIKEIRKEKIKKLNKL